MDFQYWIKFYIYKEMWSNYLPPKMLCYSGTWKSTKYKIEKGIVRCFGTTCLISHSEIWRIHIVMDIQPVLKFFCGHVAECLTAKVPMKTSIKPNYKTKKGKRKIHQDFGSVTGLKLTHLGWSQELVHWTLGFDKRKYLVIKWPWSIKP